MKTFRYALILLAALAIVAPAAAQTVHIDHVNQLFVGGTEVDDEILLAPYKGSDGKPEGVEVTINGVDYGQWPTLGLAGITIRGLGGNDTIDAHRVGLRVFFLAEQPDFAVTITGDDGDDHIRGTRGNDIIYGHAGNDRLKGGPGADILLAGDGNDIVRGGAGPDTIEGEAGDHDKLFGGCGDDKIADKDGVRRVAGGDGDDKMLLTFRDGWEPIRPEAKARISGGNGADRFELTNASPYAIPVRVNGDQEWGYLSEGDSLLGTGFFDDLLIILNVETVDL